MYIIFKRQNEFTTTLSGAANPAVHSTYEKALEEANRLSQATPGWEFIIFKAQSSTTKQIVYNTVEKRFD